jgi:hypothetical protein
MNHSVFEKVQDEERKEFLQFQKMMGYYRLVQYYFLLYQKDWKASRRSFWLEFLEFESAPKELFLRFKPWGFHSFHYPNPYHYQVEKRI